MSNLLQRIQKRIRMTVKSYRSDLHFSAHYANLRVADELGGRLGFSKLSKRAHQKREAWILNYLQHLLEPVLAEYRENTDAGTQTEQAPIWVCWWTGLETAPPLVKQCVKSIYANAGEHPVHFLTRENIPEYLEVPDWLMEKADTGKICLANFSDYIRVSLLAKYGGLWLDATIFCATTVPELYFNMPIFTCKSEPKECGYLSRMQWTSFVLGGWKGNAFYCFFREALERYWKMNDTAIDYLLVDYLIALGQQELPLAKQLFQAVPLNNPHRDDLQAAMNRADPADKWHEIIQPDTVLYKLSWREIYLEKAENGEDSVYKVFLKMELDGGAI